MVPMYSRTGGPVSMVIIPAISIEPFTKAFALFRKQSLRQGLSADAVFGRCRPRVARVRRKGR